MVGCGNEVGKYMKTFFIFISIASSIYLMGNSVRQNKSFDNFLTNLEDYVKGINDFLRFLFIRESLSSLKKLFGKIAIFFATLYIILYFLRLVNQSVMLYIGTPWLMSFYIWFSVSWVIEHKRTVKQHISKEMLFICLCPLVVLIFDFTFDTNYFSLIDQVIKENLSLLKYINIPYDDYRISWAIFYMAISILFILVWYIFTWLFIAPAFFVVLLCVVFPIFFARFFNKMFPKIPLVGVAVVLWLISFLYLTVAT